MDNLYETTNYVNARSAAFMRSKDRYGHLSNMTSGYPLTVHAITFQGPEGLYQALKYPHRPDIQRHIASRKSGMQAKRAAYDLDTNFRADWDQVRVTAMTYCLAVKLHQHPHKFGPALVKTADLPIVELSYRDSFWGAKPQGSILVGMNLLGKLLTRLRDHYHAANTDPAAACLAFLDGAHLEVLKVDGKAVAWD